MNYGAEPADQVVRYSLEGTEVALRLSGRAAVTFAKFVAAVLQDQKKTHGKTRLVRLLREGKPLKFFSVEKERMRELSLIHIFLFQTSNPELSMETAMF